MFFLSYHFFGCGVRVTRQISITVTLWILFRGVYFHCIYLTVSFLKMSSNYGLLCLKISADFFLFVSSLHEEYNLWIRP